MSVFVLEGKAVVPTGKKVGSHQGRVAVRATGSFNIQTREGVVQGISHRHCTCVQRGDGYGYQQQQSNTDAGRGRAAHDALCLPGNARVSRAIQDEPQPADEGSEVQWNGKPG